MFTSPPEEIDPLAAVSRLIRDERLKRFVSYWFEKRGSRLVTRRADIDPIEIGPILPYVWLYDYEPDTRRFRCRLAGEHIISSYRTHIVGQYLDEFLLATNWPKIEAHYQAVVDMPAIGYAIGQVYQTSLDRIGFGERVVMPLFGPSDDQVIMLIGATIYREVTRVKPEECIDRTLIPLRSRGTLARTVG